MDRQNLAPVPSEGKKTWSSPSLRTINLNSARHSSAKGVDGGGGHTKS
jgi:hypothetical protein